MFLFTFYIFAICISVPYDFYKYINIYEFRHLWYCLEDNAYYKKTTKNITFDYKKTNKRFLVRHKAKTNVLAIP